MVGNRLWFSANVFVGVSEIRRIVYPLEFDVEVADVAVVAVVPAFAVGTPFFSSERPAEISFWRFRSWSVGAFSNRPRSKDMIVKRLTIVFFFGSCIDADVVVV